MEYRIKEFGDKGKYGNHKYWLAENETGDIIGIIEVREYGNKYCKICNIDYTQVKDNIHILNKLMDKTLEYLQCNNEVCDIQILDNMTEIKELLEEYKFRIIDTSGKDDDGICAIRYLKKLK